MRVQPLCNMLNNFQNSTKNLLVNANKALQAQTGRLDRVTVSLAGRRLQETPKKPGNILESLMQQKQTIMDNKEKLIRKTLDGGGNLDIIKEQLKVFNEKLETVNEQINRHLIECQMGAVEAGDKKKTAKDEEPKTEAEIQAEKDNVALALGGSLDRLRGLSSQEGKMKGQLKVINQEIAQDQTFAPFGHCVAAKKDQRAQLEKKIKSVDKQVGEGLNQVNQGVEEAKEKANQPPVAEDKPEFLEDGQGALMPSTEKSNEETLDRRV